MCGICGCSSHDQEHEHHHDHDQAHTHHLVQIEQDLFAKNNQFAATNRHFFSTNHLTAINLMSSPGSGKTTLLSKTITALKAQIPISVVVGDQQTDYDAAALKQSGAAAIQVNTGQICHLDAHMVGHAVEDLTFLHRGVLFIENVGNLVCPALFDLGEHYRVVILSVTEGDNKPLKYPEMFHRADLVILTKMDLLPYVDFSIERCTEYMQRINPAATLFTLSAKTGEGLAEWYAWLKNSMRP